ncbi:MAG: hypothetical protein JOZ75_06215, partial [Candidatus Dormibacteraeota bacterium]|nr:hypothetical protein [Candidatus Dormibacteraeota bacterium]
MDAQSLPPQMPVPPAAGARRRVLWPLAAVAIVAIAGAGAGAYFGLRGAKGPGSGPGVTPPARAFAAAAYDEASHQVVMFGGEGADGASLGDTWTWDGTAWTQQHPASSPPPRAFAAMTYDPRKHDVVLVGGRTLPKLVQTICGGVISAGGPNATPGVAAPPIRCTPPAQSTELSDTWLWDGGTWRIAGTTPTLLPG